ncbi:MAG: hypothetical protein QNJ51_00885 [Calothrix sp. MO_167.B12]|nr:hypothetical protein [Calothrix sp. MO_167.B12]
MLRILVDADLILEALMNRQGLIVDDWELLERARPLIQIYLTDLGWQKIYNYTSRLSDRTIADIVVNWLQQTILICSVEQTTIQQARLSRLQDFESAVEIACAGDYQLDAIVTHKLDDFAADSHECLIWSLTELWVRVNLESQLKAVGTLEDDLSMNYEL